MGKKFSFGETVILTDKNKRKKVTFLRQMRKNCIILSGRKKMQVPLLLLAKDDATFGNSWLEKQLAHVRNAHKEVLERAIQVNIRVHNQSYYKNRLEKVTIQWGKAAYRQCGLYDPNMNSITINKPLTEKGAMLLEEFIAKEGNEVLKTIYHELLHVIFNKHSGQFYYFDKLFNPECKILT